jgi:glycosyltransferase involved in cell wall biosynthesis
MLSGGGTDDQCVKLVAALQEVGQQAAIAGPDHREYSPLIRRLNLKYLVTPPEGPLKLRFILAAAKWIRRENIQIVHGHHGRDYWPTVLAVKLSGVRPKLVLSRHLAKGPGSALSRRYLLNRCDCMIAVSHFVAKVLREGAYEPDSPEAERHSRPPIRGDHRRIEVIYGGIDTNQFRLLDASQLRAEWGLAPDHYAFGVVGGYPLPRGKGQREFLRAAAAIHQQVPKARFLIVGRGTMEQQLRSDIVELGLTGKAFLTPYCQNMPTAMNALDCLVHPQVGTEAFPGVIIEAYACGRPVIASALDGIPEGFAICSHGQLVKPESVDELAAAMLAWSGRPPASESDRAAMHQRVTADFSTLAFARRMIQLYHHLTPPKKP